MYLKDIYEGLRQDYEKVFGRGPLVFLPMGGVGRRLYPLTGSSKDKDVPTSRLRSKLTVPLLLWTPIELILYGEAENVGSSLFYIGVSGPHNYRAVLHEVGFGSGIASKMGIKKKIEIIHQDPVMPDYGSADSARKSLRRLLEMGLIKEEDMILVIQGDTIVDHEKVAELIRKARKRGSTAAIGVLKVPAEDQYKFGIVEIENERITKFTEKPRNPIENGYASIGVYYLNVRQLLETDGNDFGKDVLPALVKKTEVYPYVFNEGDWFDIGNPHEYHRASMYLLDVILGKRENHSYLKKMSRRIEKEGSNLYWGKSRVSRIMRKKFVNEAEEQNIEDSFFGKNPTLEGPIKRVQHSFVGNEVTFGPGVDVVDSVILSGSYIKGDVYQSTIGESVYVGRGTTLKNSMVGHESKIGDNVVVPEEGIIVPMNSFVPDGADLRDPLIRQLYEIELATNF